ncbi:hypothetical protein V757_11665 [Pelistega indica]|uniref:Helicase ATP-binding domain-containing protein n=2 Tax=Pelistega indica TaxID=1414851 RepID=V8FSA2_9BURK|nr:hypothetical protein V757_11665 [Pelistega indica]
MRHQVETARFLSENPRAFCTNQPRTGKTASIIIAQDFLRKQGVVGSALIIAPMSCLRDVWQSEIFGISPSTTVAVLHGTKQQRLKLLADTYDVYIINPDGIKVIGKELQQAVESGRISLVVIDELTDFANATSERWKVASAITKECPYVWGLTGTPGGPEGMYGMIKLVNPANMTGSFNWWRDKTMYKATQFKWQPRHNYLGFVNQVMRPTICFKKDDIMDLPPLQQFDREAPLSKEQEVLYKAVQRGAHAEGITAVNAAVMTTKLMQIVSGAVKINETEVKYLDIKPRLDVLLEIIRDTEYKVIVFAPFTATLDLLKRELSKHYSCAIVDGRVTGQKRDAIFQQFREAKDPHVLIAHPKTMSFGLELAVADTIVFWGVPLNGAFVYQQAIERINSKLQKSKTPAVIHLHSSYMERRLFKALKEGIDINSKVLDLFKEIIEHDKI